VKLDISELAKSSLGSDTGMVPPGPGPGIGPSGTNAAINPLLRHWLWAQSQSFPRQPSWNGRCSAPAPGAQFSAFQRKAGSGGGVELCLSGRENCSGGSSCPPPFAHRRSHRQECHSREHCWDQGPLLVFSICMLPVVHCFLLTQRPTNLLRLFEPSRDCFGRAFRSIQLEYPP